MNDRQHGSDAASRHRQGRPGHRPRRRRRVRDGELPEIYNALAHQRTRRSRPAADQPGRRGGAAPRRAHGALHRDGLHRRPGARHGGERHRRADHDAGGPRTLGRILNVVGEPVDEPARSDRQDASRSTARRRRSSTRRPRSRCSRPASRSSTCSPPTPRRQDRPVRRRRRRQDRAHPGAHQQRRQEARRLLGVRRRRRAHPRGQRPLREMIESKVIDFGEPS